MDVIKFRKIFYVLVTISTISVVIAILMFIVGQREEVRRKEAERKLARIVQEKEILQTELEKTINMRDKLQKDLEVAQKRAEELNSMLESVKLDMTDLKNKLSTQTMIAHELRERLEEEKNRSEHLEEEFNMVQNEKRELEIKYTDLKRKRETLESEIQQTDEKMKVELDRIVISPTQDLPGKVLVVNKNYNFIIANLGQDKVFQGNILGIYRAGKLVARARVGRTYPNMCSAEILNQVAPIMEGDQVEILR